ncbi:MAG: AraC family transcriptional regulator [Lachnospiraceae bacterium]|nr:AraC family transcriptional regulator [Lachnospiraceae bacterium]
MEKKLEIIKNQLQSCPSSHIEKISLYQGMELYFFTIKTETTSMQHPELKHIMEINYCHSGRIGWKMGNGNQIHLGPGDFSLHTLDSCAKSTLCFPTGEYEGLTLCIDLQELSAHAPELLSETGICGEMLYEKFCKNGTFASFAGNEQTDTIFSAFYEQSVNLKLAYQKIKSLELLLYLTKMEPNQTSRLTEYQSEQIEIVRAIHEHLTQNIGQRITIDALSRQYMINPTTLKEVFKSVYGTSIAAHIKEHRMELAAQLLRETNLSIAEIGQRIGYESQSRFTSAFKTYFHTVPKEYRKNHQMLL